MNTNGEKLLLKDEVFQVVAHARGLMLNYLQITGLHVGVIVNFKRRKLEWERIVLRIRVYSCPFVVRK